MKIVSVIGARPQFIKASVVSRALAAQPGVREVVIHTGQHFDANMSAVFFDQLGLPRPDHMLDIHGGHHGEMTGRMLEAIEKVLLRERPDRVLVYGDTNSTLAGALAAAKLHVPVAHVEAGLRSFNPRMPEEINRVLTDQLSDLLFCPTAAAVENLRREGYASKPVELLEVGDVMLDAALFFAEHARRPACLPEGPALLATIHRAENTDDPERLAAIVTALNHIHDTRMPVILPLHPRTRAALDRSGLALSVRVVEPVGYLEMIGLLRHCAAVLTDSGGLQKEAFFFRRPCLTVREQTEWIELIETGANRLVAAESDAIIAALDEVLARPLIDLPDLYGGGMASGRIARRIALCGQ